MLTLFSFIKWVKLVKFYFGLVYVCMSWLVGMVVVVVVVIEVMKSNAERSLKVFVTHLDEYEKFNTHTLALT